MNERNLTCKSFPDLPSLQEAILNELIRLFSLKQQQPYAVILSGGNTPLPVYRALAERSIDVSSSLHLTMSDERYVPEHDPRNNASYLLPFMNRQNIRQDRLLRVETHLPLQEAAMRYDQSLHRWIGNRTQFRFGLLGIGPDGHTASLFTREDVDAGKNHLAIAVQRPELPHRISMTASMLQRVEKLVVLAAGKQKKEIIHTLLNDPDTIPCGLALKTAPHVELWTDQPMP